MALLNECGWEDGGSLAWAYQTAGPFYLTEGRSQDAVLSSDKGLFRLLRILIGSEIDATSAFSSWRLRG